MRIWKKLGRGESGRESMVGWRTRQKGKVWNVDLDGNYNDR